MSQTKIILFYGGFAGDLITALHDIDCFVVINQNGKVDLHEEKTLLQDEKMQKIMTSDQKTDYMDRHKVISCCDTKFAFKHRDITKVITCYDKDMARFYCERYFHYHPQLKTEVDYYEKFQEWQNFWPNKFPNTVDISKIFHTNFLEDLGVEISDSKIKLFNQWKEFNQSTFSSHKESSDQGYGRRV